MKFYRTPQPFGETPKRREPMTYPNLKGMALLIRLENDYTEYRESCDLGYCKDDPEVHAKFVAAISKAEGGAQ